MAKITKKQRAALKQIELAEGERKTDRILGFATIGVTIIIIMAFNYFGYELGAIDPNNSILRAMMYITALVFAGFSGIKLMNASKKSRLIDGYRQQAGISRELLDAWKKGDIE